MDELTMMMDSRAIEAKIKKIKAFKQRAKAAFNAAFTDVAWAVSDDDKFKCAVAGLFLSTPEGSDKDWIKAQMDAIKKLNAMLSATASGLNVEVPDFSGLEDRGYGLRQLFEEAKARDDKRFASKR